MQCCHIMISDIISHRLETCCRISRSNIHKIVSCCCGSIILTLISGHGLLQTYLDIFFFSNTLSTHPLIRLLLELHPGPNLERLERSRQTATSITGSRVRPKPQRPNAGLLEALLDRVDGNARKAYLDAPRRKMRKRHELSSAPKKAMHHLFAGRLS